MTHEKILSRPDGSRVKIEIRFHTNGFREDFTYLVDVRICAPRKRKWRETIDTDDYAYRRLSMGLRKEYEQNKILEYVTKEEILQAKLELWEQLKPKIK